MKNILYLFCAFLIISCGTQQKTVESSNKKNDETVFTIIDSIQKKFDEIAKKDSLNTSQNKNETLKKMEGDVIRDYKEFIPKTYYSVHDSWDILLKLYVTHDGEVDYVGFKKDRRMLTNYIKALGEQMPNDGWSTAEKLVYWINAYNALTVDLILRNYPLKSIKDIKNPWNQRLWKLGDKWYNLDEIEHKILRKMNEPRIHFAINCASFSCPPLLNQAFYAEKLEAQLTNVTKAFLADTQRNTITEDQLEISKIFKWFAKDFKQNGSLIDFLNQYSEVKINANAKKKYKDYDWTLNE